MFSENKKTRIPKYQPLALSSAILKETADTNTQLDQHEQEKKKQSKIS